MSKRFIPLAVLALCVALVGAACGGDDEETTTETTTAATGASGASGASGQSGGGLLPDDFAEEADAICRGDKEITQDQIDELRDLGDPEEGAQEWNAFLEEAEHAAGGDSLAAASQQAEELGLAHCAADDEETGGHGE